MFFATLVWMSLLTSAPISVNFVPTPTYVPIETPKASSLYCSCIEYLRAIGVEVPKIDALWMQTFPKSVPTVGAVALFSYGAGIDKAHVALVTSLGEDSFTVKEANYYSCSKDERVVKYSDKALVGFWNPPTLSSL